MILVVIDTKQELENVSERVVDEVGNWNPEGPVVIGVLPAPEGVDLSQSPNGNRTDEMVGRMAGV
jgi:hypothetical protein